MRKKKIIDKTKKTDKNVKPIFKAYKKNWQYKRK